MFPVTTKRFAQYGIVGFLEAFGFLIEPGQVPLDNEFHARKSILIVHRPREENGVEATIFDWERRHLLGKQICMIIRIGKLVQKRARFQNKSR